MWRVTTLRRPLAAGPLALRASAEAPLSPMRVLALQQHVRFQSTRNYARESRTQSAAESAGRFVAAVRRSASFSFYTAVVLFGVGVIGVAGYFLTKELLLPTSDGQLFHKAFAVVEKDPKTAELLGTRLKAHGEPTTQRNVKSRPIASSRGYDRFGREHVLMQFHIDGDKASGLVRLEVIDDSRSTSKPDFRYIVLEVPGKPRHYIINNDESVHLKRSGGLFGIKWGPRRSKTDE